MSLSYAADGTCMGMRPRLNVRATRNYISQCDHRIDESPAHASES